MVTTMMMVYVAMAAAGAYVLWTQVNQQKPARIKVEVEKDRLRRRRAPSDHAPY